MDEKTAIMIAQLDDFYIKIARTRVYSRIVSYLFYEGRPLTTKGRWINFFVFLNYQVFSRIPAPRKVIKPIFILGTGRSGSTILGKVFSIHKTVGFLNEPKAFWCFLNEKDDIIGSYSKRKNGQYDFSEADVSTQIIKRAHNLYGWYLFFTGNRRVVDKYPEHIFRLPYLRAIFPDSKFLLLIRNGKDNSQSISKWSERKGEVQTGETRDWWGRDDLKWQYLVNQLATNDELFQNKVDELINLENHVQRGEIEWLLTMKKVLEVKADKDTYMIRYEDFVKKPNQHVANLFEFCELQTDQRVITYCNEALQFPLAKKVLDVSPLVKNDFEKVLKELGY